jgi:putative NIF3 family GTP cyclohydrolase 1 type 2
LRLQDFYARLVEEGIRRDPRGKEGVRNYLKNVKIRLDSLPANEKKFFDREKLTNPFSDTRILYGSPSEKIKAVMVGIDIETEEVLLADALRKKGRRVDLLLSHHPEGFARPSLHEVMDVQLDLLEAAGVSVKKAKKMLDERKQEVMRKTLPANTMRTIDAARLLDIPLICAHTVADNFVWEYITRLIRENKPKTVGDIIDMISDEPEYKYAASNNTGPKLLLGRPSNRCGKVIVEMTGGTEGSKKIFPELIKAGVKTIVGMHISEEHFKKAKKYALNILIAGHISSDTLGVNLLLDAVGRGNELSIIPCSGFKRFVRR